MVKQEIWKLNSSKIFVISLFVVSYNTNSFLAEKINLTWVSDLLCREYNILQTGNTTYHFVYSKIFALPIAGSMYWPLKLSCICFFSSVTFLLSMGCPMLLAFVKLDKICWLLDVVNMCNFSFSLLRPQPQTSNHAL